LVLIQEDWLDDTFGCKIHNYNWIHCSRKIKNKSEKIRGGGVSILVQNDLSLSFERLSLPFYEDFATIDITAVRLYYQNPTGLIIIDIANVYRPPTTSYIYANCSPSFNPQSLLHQLCEGNDRAPCQSHAIILCGDINCHSKLWDLHSPEDNIGKDLASSLLDYGFIIDNDSNPTYHARKCRTAPDLTAHRGDIIINPFLPSALARKFQNFGAQPWTMSRLRVVVQKVICPLWTVWHCQIMPNMI
jgi:hypothetical protein